MLLPTGRSCEDSWVVASALVPLTQRLRFLVAVRPGLQLPATAARMAATLDRISDGRLLINVVTGGDPVELRGDGVFLGHDERYVVTDEFLRVWRGLLAGETVTYQGEHLRLEDGRLIFPPVQKPYPPLYFGGSSPAGIEVAAEHCDVYLTWGEPPAGVAEKIARAREAADKRGKTFSYGIRLHVIVRETESAAWEAAESLISRLDDATIAKAQATLARQDSVGQSRMMQLHGGRRDKLVVSPNLWAGVGLVRGGAGTALVGSPDQVADRMKEYRSGHRPLHPLRLPAPGGGLPLRRAGLPQAAVAQNHRPGGDERPQRRPVRRGDRQRHRAVAGGVGALRGRGSLHPGGPRDRAHPGPARPRTGPSAHEQPAWQLRRKTAPS